MNSIRVYCFPYAGGSASAYSRWRQLAAPGIEVKPIELAARGRRMREPNYKTIDYAVADVFQIIKKELLEGPYALFGHSMGSMIAYELPYLIEKNGYPGPMHLFFSGRAAPHIDRSKKRTLHHLPDAEFKKQMLEMGGTPKEFFDHPELMEVFLPLLRGDFTLTETYTHPVRTTPLTCNITVLSGRQDEDTQEEVEAWHGYTSGSCQIHYFDGGHFFIHDETEKVMGIINNTLKPMNV